MGCASGGSGSDIQEDRQFDFDSEDGIEGGVDSDGDTIPDSLEGRYEAGGPVDTDGDGTADYLDDDSDNDTIPDSVEAGSFVSISGPVDSDNDTIPDFKDTDSDDNGIEDKKEGTKDTDGDGTGDWADSDNDGDTFSDVEEIGPDSSHPLDTDHDGKPDYMDTDSDEDLITDKQEGHGDADKDGIPNRIDRDSDGDNLTDAYEAGDDNYNTPPVDSDGDGFADFMDVDSDNDGLGDAWEVQNGLDYRKSDTDGDGYSDFIEIGADSDPLNRISTPQTVGNFFFIIDYDKEPSPREGDVVFQVKIRNADIFFLMDTTGSMGGEIDNLKTDISSVVITGIKSLIENVRFGVGAFDDYPVSPYGGAPPDYNDRVFYLLQKMTGTQADVQSAVEALQLHYGGDCSESQVPALYATITGSGYGAFLPPQLDCDIRGGEFGYPCFAPGSVPVIILITDASFHNGPGSYDPYTGVSPRPVTYDEVVTALRSRKARVISLISTSGGCGPAMEHATRLAQDTGTVDADRNPLVFGISGSGYGLGRDIVDAVRTLTGNIPVDAGISPRDDLTDSYNALEFIESLYASVTGGVPDPVNPSIVCQGGLDVVDNDGDTEPDSFSQVIPGTAVCFHIVAKRNMVITPEETPIVFRAFLDITDSGGAVLDSRKLIFMVPPHIEGPGVLE